MIPSFRFPAPAGVAVVESDKGEPAIAGAFAKLKIQLTRAADVTLVRYSESQEE
jgi:hypothetical protein